MEKKRAEIQTALLGKFVDLKKTTNEGKLGI